MEMQKRLESAFPMAPEIPKRTVDSSLLPAEMDRTGRAFDASIDELTQMEAEHDELGEMAIRALFAVDRRFLQDRWLREKATALVPKEYVVFHRGRLRNR